MIPVRIQSNSLKIVNTNFDSAALFRHFEKCKNKCDTEKRPKVTQGAQTALARMGVWGKDGNESFPRRL